VAGKRYSASSLYAQVLTELGAHSVSGAQQVAIQNRIGDALVTTWHCEFWSWRKRRADLVFTAASPYDQLPTDWDGFTLSRLFRSTSTGDQNVFLATDEQFEQMYYGASSSEPRCFRVTERNMAAGTATAVWTTVVEVAPHPDGSYTFADVEYYGSVPAISWSSTKPVDAPPEFHDIWHELALSEAAKVLGQDQKAALYSASGAAKLDTARRRRDLSAPKGPSRGLADPGYGDWQRTRG